MLETCAHKEVSFILSSRSFLENRDDISLTRCVGSIAASLSHNPRIEAIRLARGGFSQYLATPCVNAGVALEQDVECV